MSQMLSKSRVKWLVVSVNNGVMILGGGCWVSLPVDNLNKPLTMFAREAMKTATLRIVWEDE
jgi:hypothetical protein